LLSEDSGDPAIHASRERLQLAPGDHVYRIVRVRSHQRTPFLYETVSLPKSMFPNLIERGLAASALTTISNAYGCLLGNAVEKATLGQASDAASRQLNIARGDPVLLLDRISCCATRVPLNGASANGAGRATCITKSIRSN
jgi:GntR family transcriptional regulator